MSGTIIPRKNKKGRVRYGIRFPYNGRQVWGGTYSTEKDAKRVLKEICRKIELGEYYQTEPISFNDLANLWYEQKAILVTEKTSQLYRSLIELHILPSFCYHRLIDIDIYSLQKLVTEKLQTYSPQTVIHIYNVLNQIFETAIDWNYAKENPMKRVKRPQMKSKALNIPTLADIKDFLRAVDPHYRPLFLTAIYTGMRRGELIELRWSDVNLATGSIIVQQKLKTSNALRTIMIPDSLIAELKALNRFSKYVFITKERKKIIPRNLIRTFQRALKKSGVNPFRFHDLRHLHASLLISQNEDIKFIQSQLGHASAKTTLDRYGHLIEKKRDVANRLEKLFSSETVAFENSSELKS